MIPADEQAESEATPDDTASEEVAPEANAPKIVHFDFYSPDQVPGIQTPVDELDCECPHESGVTR